MENKMKKGNAGVVLLIIILFVIIIVMGVYMLIDKTSLANGGNENGENNSGSTNIIDNAAGVDNNQAPDEIKKENADFFDEYLEAFLPQYSSGYFQKNISEFTDEDIEAFLFYYVYNNQEKYEVFMDYNVSSEISCKVTKSELDEIVDKYFNKGDTYTIDTSTGRSGFRKISDEVYEVFWFATSSMRPRAYVESIKYYENEVQVIYTLYYAFAAGAIDDEKLIFNLEYSDGRYIVKGIVYDGTWANRGN